MYPMTGYGLMLTLALLAGCSRTEPPPAVATPAAPAVAQAPDKPTPTACALLPAAEMGAILGGAVRATADESRSFKTSCFYAAVSDKGPMAELTIDWGAGEGGMRGAGMANRAEPGVANPLAGLGDDAVQLGMGVMIRHGEHLVTILHSSADDPVAKTRKVFEAVKAKL